MTIQQLEYIVSLNKHRHFVEAAEACHVTQPTLSSMIRKLEEELDVIIFDRNTHPIEPTVLGAKIIEQASVVLFNVSQMREMILDEKGMEVGELKLAVIPTIAPYILPSLINNASKNSPGLKLKVSEVQTKVIIDLLHAAEIDIGLLATPLEDPELLEIPLYNEKFCVYASPLETEIYNQKEINAPFMPTKHLWVLQEGHCFRAQIFNFCNHHSDYSTVFEAGSIDTLVKIVDKNGGYTVIPELHLSLLTNEQLKNVRPFIAPQPSRQVSFVIRKDFVKEKFLNILAANIKTIVPEHMIDAHLKKFDIKI
ncbi:MAG: LysR substrate-binding domain-containing protein [Bacteroidales bacterium]